MISQTYDVRREYHKFFAQVKRLKALESREAKEKREEAAREAARSESTAVKQAHTRRESSAVDAQQKKSKAAKQSASKQSHSGALKLSAERSAHVMHTVKHADAHALEDAPVMQHLSINTHASQHKLAEAAADEDKAEGKEGEGEGEKEMDRGIPAYKDIGWEKQQWDVGSWVLFAIMGPIVTLGICGIVWHSAGWFAALVMLFILLCMDISAYYYSWFLV